MANNIFTKFKGINRLADIANMPNDYLYDVYNGYLSKENAIKKRFGYEKKYSTVFDSGASIINFFEALWDDGSKTVYIASGTKVAIYDSGTPEWDTIHTFASASTFIDFAQYGDQVIFCNGVNDPQLHAKGGASSSNLGGTAPSKMKLVRIHENRAWAIDADDPYAVYYSVLGDIEDWTTSGDDGAGYLNLQAYVSKGDAVKAIDTFASSYLVFFMKNHTITYNIGTVASNFAIAQINVNTGVNSPKATLPFGNDLYYLDEDSPKSFQSSLAAADLDINDFTKGLMGEYYREMISGQSGARVCIEKYLRKSWIVIHIPITATTGEILIWDYMFNAWVGRWRINDQLNCMFINSDDELLFTSSDGYVYKFDESKRTDDGETIDFTMVTPMYWGTDPASYERYPFIEFVAETETNSTNVEVSAYYDFEDEAGSYEEIDLDYSGSFWDEALWDVSYWSSSGKNVYRSYLTGRGKATRFSFRNNQADKDVEIKMFQLPQSITEGYE